MPSLHEGSSWMSNVTPYLLYTIAITTLGPLLFGFHLAELNAPADVITCRKKDIRLKTTARLPQCIPMNPTQFGLVSSIFTLGGVVGALTAGPCSTKYGRLLTMRVTTLFFILGATLEALAANILVFSIGRVISGLGAGAAIVVVPVYISEVAPPGEKGTFGALTQISINLGILVTQALGLFLSRGQLWRVSLGVGGGLGILQLAGLLAVSESPQWLGGHGDSQTAREVLRRIRGDGVNLQEEANQWIADDDSSVESDLILFGNLVEERALLSSQSTSRRNSGNITTKGQAENPPIGVLQIILHPGYRPAIIAVVGVMLAQQLCGINSIVMYSVSLLSTLLPTTSALLTVVVSAVNLVVTTVCAPLSDRIGRKVCLLLSIAGMGVNSILLAISIYFSIPILSAVATLLFVASFAVGLGPVPFILATELVGPEAVGATQSWALAANWIATFLVAQFFPMLNTALGRGRVYYVFAGLAAASFAFVLLRVPESKGKKNADEVWARESRVD